MDQFDTVKNMLLKFSYLGIEESNLTGVTLIGKAPHIAEEAWLNRIYTPITSDEIYKIESAIKKKIPMSYAQFLTKYSNGLNILGDSLCLFGYRANYIRDTNAAWQPYSIADLNKFDKPRNSTDNMFFIGSYDSDGSFLYMTPDQRVHFCKSADSKSMISWDSIYSMLVSEIERLYTLFNSKGVQIDEDNPTTPKC